MKRTLWQTKNRGNLIFHHQEHIMLAIDQYSLFRASRKKQCSMLKRQGHTNVVEVDGVLLEAQFELDDGNKLIWLSDDSPFDEGLHIYLLGPDDMPIDSLQAGNDFSAGILKIREIGSRSVDFEFFLNSVVYRLEIEQTPRHHMWLPTGWKYKHHLKRRRLVVSQLKAEER